MVTATRRSKAGTIQALDGPKRKRNRRFLGEITSRKTVAPKKRPSGRTAEMETSRRKGKLILNQSPQKTR